MNLMTMNHSAVDWTVLYILSQDRWFHDPDILVTVPEVFKTKTTGFWTGLGKLNLKLVEILKTKTAVF